jgi:Flp pilus assembly protein TadD
MSPRLAIRLRRTGSTLVALALLSVGARAVETTPILRPSLEGVEDKVKELFADRLGELEELLEQGSETDPKALAAAYGELGRLYLVYSLPESAESCFVNARRLEPDQFLWAYLLGTIVQERGDWPEAEALLEAARALDPGNPTISLRLAQLAFERGDLEVARGLYSPLSELAGFGAAANYGLGRIAAADGDFEAAARYLEEAVAEQPEASQVRYQLALVYRRLGDPERAREQLAARGSGQLAFPDPVMQQVGSGAQGAEIFLAAGRKARHEGDLETAVAAFRQAVEEDPEDPGHRRILAATLQQAGRIDESIEVYRETLRLAPDDSTVLYNLASAWMAKGEVAKAEPLLRRVVELVPDHADGRVNLAAVYEQWGRLNEADLLLQEALVLDPYDTDLIVRRAAVLNSLGRAGEARTMLESLVADDPGDALAWVELGSARAALGESAMAEEAWRRATALESDPGTAARARFLLARALQQRGLAGEAVVELREAARLLPDNSQLRMALAGALGAVGDFDGAAEEYGFAIRVDPRDTNARFGRAISLLLAGHEAAARQHLEESLAGGPASLPLEHLLARLLATASDANVRDGARALAMAQQIFQREQTIDHAETIAMAQAELGAFDAALEWQARILEQARSTGQTRLVPRLEARRDQYSRGEPVRTPWREGS